MSVRLRRKRVDDRSIDALVLLVRANENVRELRVAVIFRSVGVTKQFIFYVACVPAIMGRDWEPGAAMNCSPHEASRSTL